MATYIYLEMNRSMITGGIPESLGPLIGALRAPIPRFGYDTKIVLSNHQNTSNGSRQ